MRLERFAKSRKGLIPELTSAPLRHFANRSNTFERIAQASTVSVERQPVDDEAAGGMTLLARYSDLVVVGQANCDDPYTGLLQDLPEYVALGSGRPVLVVPFAGGADGPQAIRKSPLQIATNEDRYPLFPCFPEWKIHTLPS